MAFTATALDVALTRNERTNKFTIHFTNGNPDFSSDLSHAVLSLIYEYQGQYWADTTGLRGSRLYSVKNLFSSTASQVQAYIVDALQPLVILGKILKPADRDFVSVKRNVFNRNRLDIVVNYSTPSAKPVTVTVALG